tara:strand:- start:477 stop:1034 length:558 start_codon:yes stop_codon:yes gene_type:complete
MAKDKFKNVEKYLNSLGKYVVKQSRTMLTKAKKNVDKNLYNSIKYKVVADGDDFILQFYMLDYGKFVDKGVSGKKKIQEYTTWDKRKVASPFQYKTKGPPIDIISKWIKKRGIKPKGLGKGRSKETGQYLSGFAYLISKKIKRDGIKSLGFFQRPLGLGMKDFGKDLLKAVKKDVTDSLSKTQVN